MANFISKLQNMLLDIHDISKPEVHLGKTKVMCYRHVNKNDVIVVGKKIEEIDKIRLSWADGD